MRYSAQVPRVLVADDEQPIRCLVAQVLAEELGAEIEGAADGRAAIVALVRFRPQALVLDLRMAPVDGFAVLRWLRTRPREERPPVLVLTAAGSADCAEAMALGSVGCLAKPFDLEELIAAVRGLL